MKAIWITDIHLDFLDPEPQEEFFRDLGSRAFDIVLLGGDIARADSISSCLQRLAGAVKRPVYFVLGNHDYYRGSIQEVRNEVSALCDSNTDLIWLSGAGAIPLSKDTCLIGHDGWGDGRNGNGQTTPVHLNDFELIEELKSASRAELLFKLQQLGDEAAQHLRAVLPDALGRFRNVIFLTHVPPFPESAWHEGRPSNDDWLPFFSCRAVGDVLLDVMAGHAGNRMTVLCGHTHGEGVAQVLPNLTVRTGGALYEEPGVQDVLDVI